MRVSKSKAGVKKLLSKATCDAGFKFSGKCLNTVTGLTSLPFPGTVGTILNGALIPILVAATGASEVCMGDYLGSFITNSAEKLATFTCNNIPLNSDNTFGILGGVVRNVPCGTPQTVSMCVAFDQCGTFALSINGGVAQCLATYSTGIAAILGPLASAVDYANLAFSIDRKLTRSFKVAYGDGENVTVDKITTKGHFFFGLGLMFPMDFIKINGKSLQDMIGFKVDMTLLIDFGNATSVVSSFIDQIVNANKDSGKTILNTILKSGGEVTAAVAGLIVLKFEEMTNGFLHDFSIEIASANLLITTGNGSSGRKTGIYLFLSSDIVSSLLSSFEGVYNHFASILGAVGFSKPNLSGTDISLGLFIQSDSMGFQFNLPGFTVKCIFKFSGSKGGCKFSDKFFTAIAEGAKWVIKKADKFFDDTGEKIAEISQGIGKFAVEQFNSVKKFAEEKAAAIKKAAEEAAAAAKKAAEEAAAAAKKAAEEAAKKAAEEAAKAAEAAKKAAEEAAKKVADAAKSAANSVKKAFKKW